MKTSLSQFDLQTMKKNSKPKPIKKPLLIGLLLLFTIFLQVDVMAAGVSTGAGIPTPGGRMAVTTSQIYQPKRIQAYDKGSLNIIDKVSEILKQSAKQTYANARVTTATPISLTEAEMNAISAPRSSWLTLFGNTSTATMDIGIADNVNAQTWTLPAGILNLFEFYNNEDFIPIAEVPAELKFAGANKVVKTEYEDNGGNIIEVYDHYILDNDAIDYIGISYYYYLDEDADAFDPVDYKFSDVPLQLNDSYVFEESETQSEFRNLKYYESNKTVDAFGTLTTPYGNFDCLRISFSTTEYTRPDISSVYTAGTPYTSVGFITEQGHYFVAKTSGTSGSVTLDDIQFQVVAPTGILQDQSEVQINNDANGVLISNTPVSINVLNKSTDKDAILDIQSNDKGIMIPRLAMANRPAAPSQGLLIYQTDNTPGFYYYDGSAWTRLDNTTPSSGARIAAPAQGTSQAKGVYKKGFSKLVNGTAFVPFKANNGLNPEEQLIQLQAEGKCNGLYISKKTAEGFEVKELNNGKSNIKFSWTLN